MLLRLDVVLLLQLQTPNKEWLNWRVYLLLYFAKDKTKKDKMQEFFDFYHNFCIFFIKTRTHKFVDMDKYKTGRSATEKESMLAVFLLTP